ncbi:MAG: metalloregulator ArsR/SmtB family transcription factor [Bacteroidota bacterium]
MIPNNLRSDPIKTKRIARTMKYLGHPVRLMIVELLIDQGAMPVKEIYEAVGISQSNASQHLRTLETAEILYSERKGTSIFYRINNPGVPNLLQCAYQTTLGEEI